MLVKGHGGLNREVAVTIEKCGQGFYVFLFVFSLSASADMISSGARGCSLITGWEHAMMTTPSL